MKFGFLKRRKFWRRLLIWLVAVPVLLFFTVVGIVYWKQDAIVQELVKTLNEDFVGEIEIKDSHVAPFENFPYISIDLNHLKIYEDKQHHEEPICDIEDVYVGFDFWTLLSGDYDIKVIELKEGYIHAIQHENGELNITRALSQKKEVDDLEEELHIHLKSIELINIDMYKLNEANGVMVESFVDHADVGFKSNDEHVLASVDAQIEMNVILRGDTTFFKHKHFDVKTEVEYLKKDTLLMVNPSELELENATFSAEGMVDIANDFDLDMVLYGKKKNFELFMALAPEDLASTLAKYDNAGDIAFEVQINGKSAAGYFPHIDATFSCHDAFFSNNISNKKVEELNFSGRFTNNGEREPEHMEFELNDFTAKPEAGNFEANLYIKNFASPEIDMTLDSDFDLNFLAQFINATSFEDLHGKIQMHMKFHDIVDLEHPERSVEKLNEAYYSELLIEDLSFNTPAYHLGLSNLDTKMTVDGHAAKIDYFRAKVGQSDLNISGHISDLPAILHHTDDEVIADLVIKSERLDLREMTSNDTVRSKPVDERLDNLKMKLKFISSARNFTESPNLPVGEFFVDDFYVKLQHYPHTFHDFRADLFVEDSNFRVIDFSGMIDESDFHFHGELLDYERWLEEHPKGDTKIDFDLTSKALHLDDLFSYKGENYVPKDYRHEELDNLKLHGSVELHFDDGLRSSDFRLTEVNAKMKIHPLRFEKFNGRVHYEDDHLVVQELSGKIGKSVFDMDMNYYFGEDENIRKRDNHFGFRANYLDFDELFNYNLPQTHLAKDPGEHEDVFNIYELPFSTMTFDIDVGHMRYHRYMLDDVHGRLRTTPDHYIYIDTLRLKAAGGKIMLSGYFNGSDKDKIYFKPKLKLENVDLDRLMFKFENFGQDHLVSENIHGKITTTITGKIHVHADMIPILDDSEIHMDVSVLNGRLVDFEPIVDLKEYFVDKNVHNVRFDTLQNHIDLKNGNIEIPHMTINSTLGYMIVSGKQDMYSNMEYYIRVPLKLVAGTGFKTLFGRSKEEVDPDQVDEIEYLDPEKKTIFVNIKVVGDENSYKVSLGKDKRNKRSS